MKESNEQLNVLFNIAHDIAIRAIEKEARRLMNEDKNLVEFIMAMGSWDFIGKNGKHVDHKAEHIKPLDRFIRDNDYLGLMGTPMRFTKNSGITTNW